MTDPTSRVELELARRLAGTRIARERQAETIAALAARADWDRLGDVLEQQRLLVLLGRRLIAMARTPVPPGFRARLQAEEARARHHASLMAAGRDRALAALAAAGVPALALKGTTLAQQVHGDCAARPCGDVDVLVRLEDLDSAVAALAPAGWSEPQRPPELPRLHRQLLHAGPVLPPVELHWRVHWYEQEFSRHLLADALANGGRPSPPLELASLLLFYARDGFVGLRYAADLTAWWDVRGGELPPLALAEIAAVHPRLGPVLRAAVDAAHRVVGLPSSLADGLPRRARGRIAARTANWRRDGGTIQHAADFTLVDWLVTPLGGQRAFVHRHLFPPTAVVARDYGLDSRPWAARTRRLLHGRGVTTSLASRWLRTLLRAVPAAPGPRGAR